jgi:hypothetical protein
VASQQALLRSLSRDADPEVRSLAGERLASHLPTVLEVFSHG